MAMASKKIKNDKIFIYALSIIKQYKIKTINESVKNFPYDYRYVILKEDNIDNEILKKILESYTDEELDFLLDELESNIFELTFDAVTREENEIFNKDNDKKVLTNCMNECKKRNLI